MGLQAAPSYIGDSGFQTPVENDRKLIEGMFNRGGLLRSTDFALTSVVGSMAAQVSAGVGAIVKGLTNTTQGSYFAWSNAAENIAWPAADSQPRYDTLLLRIVDTQYGADGTGSRAAWEVVSGTPAASPSILTDAQIDASFPKPGAWLALYDVLVPAAATSLTGATITKRGMTTDRPSRYATSLGYTPYYSTQGVPASGKWAGERFWEIDTAKSYLYDGTNTRLENPCKHRTPAGIGLACLSTESTSSSSYASMNGSSSFSFTKQETHTRIKVYGSATFLASGGNAIMSLAARINSTDYEIAAMAPNTSAIGCATGVIFVSGISAGTYTVQARWKRTAGSGSCQRTVSNDWLSLMCEEVV